MDTVKVLLVEDNPADKLFMEELLGHAPHIDFRIHHEEGLQDALRVLETHRPDLIFLDLSLPDSVGIDSLDQIRARAPDVPVVVMTALADTEMALRAVQHGAQDYLLKGTGDIDTIVRSACYAIERNRLLTELERTRCQQLEIKDRFLSHVSHELRTPLAVIYQFISLVRDQISGPINSQQKEFLDIAVKNVDILQRMIDDLLEVTRTSTGKIRIDPTCVSLDELIRESVRMRGPTAETKDLSLKADIPHVIPPAYGDATRIRQILANLIDNAIKFTPSGGRIEVHAELSDQDDQFLVISVSDTGCGISPEGVKKVFDRLHQETQAAESSRQGLGLGLHICKELVTRQGGRIWLESVVGSGTTFHFTIPVYSLEKDLRPLVSKTKNEGSLGLISIHLAPTSPLVGETIMRKRMWNVLEKCIDHERDALVPRASYKGEDESFFIVTSAPPEAAQSMVKQIEQHLGHMEVRQASIRLQEVGMSAGVQNGQHTHPMQAYTHGLTSKVQAMIQSETCKDHGNKYEA